MIRLWLAFALAVLVTMSFAAAVLAGPLCVPPRGTLDALNAMGMIVEDVTGPAQVKRGTDFLLEYSEPVSPAPDRILLATDRHGVTALIFGHHGLVCPPIIVSRSFARRFRAAIFGASGEDI